MCVHIYLEVMYVCMSPLLVARALYDVKEVELDHIHFYRMAKVCGMWEELNITVGCSTNVYLKGSALRLLVT